MAGTDWALIEACRQGNEEKWKELVQKYKGLVFSIPLNHGLGQEDAADVVQLTFMMLMQGLDNLHQDSHLGGWLATVARRNTWHLINRRRRENMENRPLGEVAVPHDEESERQNRRWELLDWLYDGLAQLDETCRRLLRALYFDAQQPTYVDVASRLGLAVGSIGPMRARCLQRLRVIMRDRT